MIIRQLCLGAAVIGLIASASGGCSNDSSTGTTSSGGASSSSGSSGASSSSSGSSGASSSSSGSSGASSGSSGTSSGSSGTSSGSSGTSGGTDGGSDGGAVSCATYCSTIKAKCIGATNTQYMSDNGCATVCAALPLGTSADTGGQDSVGCRTYHANNTPADTHCPHAGPFGAGVCGADCDTFCEIAQAACGALAAPPFANLAACKTECGVFVARRSTARVNAAQPTAGDTFDCRAWHLLKATDATANVATHCPHIATVSAQCHQ